MLRLAMSGQLVVHHLDARHVTELGLDVVLHHKGHLGCLRDKATSLIGIASE